MPSLQDVLLCSGGKFAIVEMSISSESQLAFLICAPDEIALTAIVIGKQRLY